MSKTENKFKIGQLVVTTETIVNGCGEPNNQPGTVVKVVKSQPDSDGDIIIKKPNTSNTYVKPSYVRPLKPGYERMNAKKMFAEGGTFN